VRCLAQLLELVQHLSLVHVPSWSSYGEFLALACILVLIPGPDFAVVVKNTLMAGKRAGVCYLAFLGFQAMRSAIRGSYDSPTAGNEQTGAAAFGGWRQGFVSNITNPKVLVFYLAVLPQFLHPGAAVGWLLAFAWSHALLSLLYLLAVSAGLMRVRQVFTRRSARRTLDIAAGTALLGFSARLAAERI